MINLIRNYKTYITELLPNNVIGEYALVLNDAPNSDIGYLLLEPGTVREESIFYHRSVGNTVYIYQENRDNPFEHADNSICLLANSIDYMNYLIGQSHDQCFIYKIGNNDLICKGGKFYIGGTNIDIPDLDTSLELVDKTLVNGGLNYIYIVDNDFKITQSTIAKEAFLVATVDVGVGGAIVSITKHKTFIVGNKGEKGDQGIQGVQGPQGIQGETGPQGIQGIQGNPGVDGRTILYGTSNPTTQGVNGDFYINTTTNYLFGPKSGGLWGTGISLVGPIGPQGIQGIQGPQGIQGVKGDKGDTGNQGIQGDPGKGIVSIIRTSGTGAAGTTDTYTITYTDSTTSTFTVYNGADGLGSGDMSKSTYDTNNNGIVDNSEALNGQSGSYYLSTDNHTSGTTNKVYTASEQSKLSGIEAGAEVNNISDINATDLTDGGDTTLHTHDGRYYTETETDTLLSGKLNTSLKGAVNGLAELDAGGKVPTSQLPSYVDDVLEYANLESFPVTGETGKIYIALDTNYSYRWGGSNYIEIADGKAIWGGISGTLSNQTDLQNALNAKANDNEVLKLSGNQTIAGIKTFSNNPVVSTGIEIGHASDTTITRAGAGRIAVEGIELIRNGDNPTLTSINISNTDTTITRVSAGVIAVEGKTVATTDGTVNLTGNQIIDGVKTFSSSPIVPTPTTDMQVATKKYVDDNAGGGGGSNPIYQTYIAGEQTTGLIGRFVSKGTQTIAGVKISLGTLPTGANFSVDVRKNGTATTNSIFTGDTPISITTSQGATNGIYITTGTAIDNGSLVENDVLYFIVTAVGTTLSGTDLEVIVY